MAALTTTPIALTGTVASPAAASGSGDTCTPGNATFVQVVNSGTSSTTVTVDSVTPSSYGNDDDIVVTVASGVTKLIGPLPAQRFANASDGLVHWTYSSVLTGATFNLTNRVLTSNVATLTTSAPHGFLVGQTVVVASLTGGDTIFNGTWVITGVTSTTFDFALVHANVTTGATSGSGTSTNVLVSVAAFAI